MSFSQSEARKCFNEARRALKHPGLTILLAPHAQQFGRILVVIPRRAGNAPQRNKIRRRLKAVFHEEKLFEYPFDCIVIIRQEAQKLSFDELKELLVTTIKKTDDATHTIP